MQVVERGLLEAVAKLKPSLPNKPIKPSRNGYGELDLERWIREHNVPVEVEKDWQGNRLWIPEECPWNGHTDRSAYLIQYSDGGVSAACHHNSCQGKGWKEFREHYEPGCYERGTRERPAPAAPDFPASGTLLSEVEPERVSWLWRGWLALGKLSVIDGDPGLGKSAAVLDIAARVSTGRSFPDGSRCEAGAGGVVILSAEDGLADTIKPRLDAAGADTSRILSLATVPVEDEGIRHERLLSIPEDIPLIEHAVGHIGAKLVIVDPLMAFLSGEINSHKDQDVRRALAPLAAMAERAGAAIHVVRHLSKGDGRSPIYRGGGSIGIIGAARMGSLVAKDPQDDNRRVLAPTKNNLAMQPKSLLYRLEEADNGAVEVVWTGETGLSAGDLLQTPNGAESEARTEAEDFLTSLLADGPVPSEEVFRESKEAGISTSTLRRAKKNLGISPERENESGGKRGSGKWVWKLPKITVSGHDVQDVQRAQGREPERLERNRADEPPESGLDKPILQDVQVNGRGTPASGVEHLEAGRNGRPLLVEEILREINRPGSEAAEQASLYRRGYSPKETAVEQIAQTILRHKGADTGNWQASVPVVEAALSHTVNCECEECL